MSHHACLRYQQRVEPCTIREARAHILESEKAIAAAANFGCQVVRRAHGERLVLEGMRVVTVYAADNLPHQIRNPFNQCQNGEGEQL